MVGGTALGVWLWLAPLLAGAVGPPAPDGVVEGDIVEVAGIPYQVHGGVLYTLDDPALADARLTVTVTGSDVDKSKKKRVMRTDQITGADISETGAHTLADVLQSQAGLQVTSTFGLAQGVQLDGLDGREVLVLIDGRPVKGRIDSKVDVARLPVSASSIERIEIVRGPMSALYGSEALGGVINIVTKKPSQALGGEAELGLQWVPRDGLWTTLGAHGRGGAGPIAARVDITTSEMPGVELPDRRQTGVHAEAAVPLVDDVSFRAQLDGASSEAVTQPAQPFSERDQTTDWSLAALTEADLAGLGGHGAELSLDLRVDTVRHIFDKLPSGSLDKPGPSFCTWPGAAGGDLFDPACPVEPVPNTDAADDESRVELKYIDPVVRGAPGAEELTLSLGATVTREQARRVNGDGQDSLPGGGERDIAAFFGEVLYRPLPWLSIVPGGRVDVFTPQADARNAAFGPKLALRAELPAGFAVRASYGRGFRLPSFEERLLRFDHSALGYIVLGNPQLLPETSDGVRGEVAWEPTPEVELSTEVYLNLIENLINEGEPKNDAVDGVPVFTYVNAKRAYTSGVNVRANVGPFVGFSLVGGYQYLINAVDASACPKTNPYFCGADEGAASLPLRPAHAVDATLRYRIDATGTVLFTRADGLSERPIDAVTVAPAYVTFAAGVRQPLTFFEGTAGAEVTLSVEDLTDAFDPIFGPKPGRAVSLSLRAWN